MTTREMVTKFFGSFPKLSYTAGSVIVRSCDAPAGIMYIVSGVVRMSCISANGELVILHLFQPGSFFPMTWAIGDAPNRYDYEAVAPVTLYRAPRLTVMAWLKNHPEILWSFTRRICAGMGGLLERIEGLVVSSAYEKVVSLLLHYARHFGVKQQEGTLLSIPLTHKEIAGWIGTTRETASLQIELLLKKNLIVYRGRHIIIPQVDHLERELKKG